MTSERSFWRRLFVLERPRAPALTKPGLYHAMRERDGTYARYHLRVDNDGSSTLVANATATVRLTPTGTVIAHGLLHGQDEASLLKTMQRTFPAADPATIRADIGRVRDLLDQLAQPSDNYPVLIYHDNQFSPHTAQLVAPLQATLQPAPLARTRELLQQLWEIGIPHITLLVTPRDDMPNVIRCIEAAEDIGMIAGMRALAQSIDHADTLHDLAMAGVDYVLLPCHGNDPAAHDALYGDGDYTAMLHTTQTLHEYEVCPVAEVPLIDTSAANFAPTLTALPGMGFATAALFALSESSTNRASDDSGGISPGALLLLASYLDEHSYALPLQTMWQPVTLRDPALPLATQLQRGPRCTADVSIHILPDGGVIPHNGAWHVVGNVLTTAWATIWQHPAFRVYRESVAVPEEMIGAFEVQQVVVNDRDRPAPNAHHPQEDTV